MRRILLFALFVIALFAVFPMRASGGEEDGFFVFLERGADEFEPAARAMAEAHGAPVLSVDRERLRDPDALVPFLRTCAPRYAVFVLRPETLDVDLAHAVLASAVRLDDDSFPDFAYGFVTGRDGEAALAFVRRSIAARLRRPGRRVGLFGTWEGISAPSTDRLPVARALGVEAEMRLLPIARPMRGREDRARAALERMGGRDVLLFFSHGLPDRMVGCFDAQTLSDAVSAGEVDLGPAVLVNCACFNGVTGGWFLAGEDGRFRRQPPIAREDSIALAFLESGVSAYVAGLDVWHGPIADVVFFGLVDGGLTLGEAVHLPACRLALDLWPDKIDFRPAEGLSAEAEGLEARRRLLASAVLFGDPSFAPFEQDASHRWRAGASLREGGGAVEIVLEGAPLAVGPRGPDLHLAESRLADPTSVRTGEWREELGLEVYRVVPWPRGAGRPIRARVERAVSGETTLPAGEPRVLLEQTPRGQRAHVRVPIRAKFVGNPTALQMAARGFFIRLEVETGTPARETPGR